MCCSTGVCGTDIDPVLPRFAADLEWLRTQGINIERYNLAQQPGLFVANETVKAALHEEGNGCLPLILVDGQIISRAAYPERAVLRTTWASSVPTGSADAVGARRLTDRFAIGIQMLLKELI